MAWANFADKTADINDSANYVQGSMQGSMPDPQQLGDYWVTMHPQWREVADTWTPPNPPISKEQSITELNQEYFAKLYALKELYASAYLGVSLTNIDGSVKTQEAIDTEVKAIRDGIKVEYDELHTELLAKQEVILGE